MSAATAAARTTALSSLREQAQIPAAIFFLYCYFLIDYFARFAARLPVYGQFRPTLVLVLVLTGLLLTQSHKLREHIDDRALKIAFLFLLYLFISFPLVEWPGSIIRHNLPDFVRAFVFLFFTAIIVDSDRRLKIFVGLFLALQIFRVLEPFYLNLTTGYLGDTTYVGGEFVGRLSGAPADVINPNGLGFVIATCFGLMHFLMWQSRRKALKLLYLILLPCLFYALMLTASRTGYLATALVLAFIFFKSPHKAVMATVVFVAFSASLPRFDDFYVDRFTSLWSDTAEQRGTVEGRWDGAMAEFRLGMNRPFVGHGLGTTPEAKVHFGHGRPQAAHNMYAEVLIEVGIIGFVIFFTMIYHFYRRLRENAKRLTNERVTTEKGTNFQLRLNNALLATFFMYLVVSFANYGLNQEYWYVLGGLIIAFGRSLDRTGVQRLTSDQEMSELNAPKQSKLGRVGSGT